jgi:mannonate dehydratase
MIPRNDAVTLAATVTGIADDLVCDLLESLSTPEAYMYRKRAEQYGVKTAWHGAGDVSPVGHIANITLAIVSYNFGIQEYTLFNAETQEIFKGCPEMKDGYFWVNERPG